MSKTIKNPDIHKPIPETIPGRDPWYARPPSVHRGIPAKILDSEQNPKITAKDLRNDPRIMKHGVLTDQATDVIVDGARMAGFLPDDLAQSPVLKSLVKNVLGPALLNMGDAMAIQEQKTKVAVKTCDYCGGTGKVNFGIITGERPCPKCG